MSKQITVFGASGRVGRLVVAEALARGYQVVAAIHTHPLEIIHPSLSSVSITLDTPASIATAITASDAVISTVSSWKDPHHTVLTRLTELLITALPGSGINRLISLTGSDAVDGISEPPPANQLFHAGLALFARPVLEDGERHIELLRDSTLNWTVIRSPVMIESESREYGLLGGFTPPWSVISRQAVAACLVDQIESTEWIAQAPVITTLQSVRTSNPIETIDLHPVLSTSTGN